MSAPDAAVIEGACLALTRKDPVLARAHAETGTPAWRAADPIYETLARLVCFQQISTTAGAAIWGRFSALLPKMTEHCVLAAEPEDLQAVGLSRPKVRSLKTIAEAVASKAICLQTVTTLTPETARAQLTAVKGIGPWTANLFLLYAGGDLDAIPTADVGLMESHKLLSGAGTRMTGAEFTDAAEVWRPYRGVAAHLLWAWINDHRGKESAPRE